MTSSVLAVVVDCRDPQLAADFWARVLSSSAVERNPDEFLVPDPTGQGAPLYFMKVPEPKVGKNRLHVDLLTDGALEDEVKRIASLGARLVEILQDSASYANPDRWAVMEDPEGNVFCVSSAATLTGWQH